MPETYSIRGLPDDRQKHLIRLTEFEETVAARIAHDRRFINNRYTVHQNPDQQLLGARAEMAFCKGMNVSIKHLNVIEDYDAILCGQRCDIKGYRPHYQYHHVAKTLRQVFEQRAFDWYMAMVAHDDGALEWIGGMTKARFAACYHISPGPDHGHDLDEGTPCVPFSMLTKPQRWCTTVQCGAHCDKRCPWALT
jgi:hypothetical protein